MTRAAQLVEDGDLDELVREVDRLCERRAWDELIDLRDRCRRALERGKQLWPVASHAEYRLALEAPGPWAARVLLPDAGRFALGPLAEVAASSHSWAELAPHAPPGPVATLAAHERVVRGEDLTTDAHLDPLVLELPLCLQSWEPTYPVAVYGPHEADFGAVRPPTFQSASLPAPARVVRDHDVCRALLDLADAWVTESNGRAQAVAVEGNAPGAIARLTNAGEARVGEVEPHEALATMAWTGASGGAHGRRRGTAAGRFGAWWAAGALTGLLDPWPVDPDELGAAVARLGWYRWEPPAATSGWSFRLAVEDRARDRAWAVEAHDHVQA